MDALKKKEVMIIVDGNSVVYRSFHALPQSLSNSKGLPTNAIYGFTRVLIKILKDFSPQYLAVAFDVKGPTFRHEMFKEYKAERPPMPDSLSSQMPYIKAMVNAFRVPVLESPGYEADDIIACLVKRFKGAGIKVLLITGDKDMCQLVDTDVGILDYSTGEELDSAGVCKKFGVLPEQIPDLLALAGDSTDNIPGVHGIGPKTACDLIRRFGSLSGVYENIENIGSKKLTETLKKHREDAFMSKALATLNHDMKCDAGLTELKFNGPDVPALKGLLSELEFRKLLSEITSEQKINRGEKTAHKLISTEGELKGFVEVFLREGLKECAIAFVLEGVGALARLKGLAFAVQSNDVSFIKAAGGQGGFLTEAIIFRTLKPIFEDNSIKKNSDSLKQLCLLLSRHGVQLNGAGIDASIASYLLDPSMPKNAVLLIDEKYGLLFEEIRQDGGHDEPIDTVCKKAIQINEIAGMLNKKLDESGLLDLYLSLELPLVQVLCCMESLGIKVNAEKLKELSVELGEELKRLENTIYRLSDAEFNINSPKQMSEILFEKMGLKPMRIKKTKSGYSTDEESLKKLFSQHEIAGHILNYRQLNKLKGTYIDALMDAINPDTLRVHTTFNQTVTSTGRLSSSNPNLQNIPVKGEYALRIREAFEPVEGSVFICADYSQIELRLLAHLSGDERLIDAFMNDKDIHAETAAEVFGVIEGLVTPELRRRAKAINFGIIYGMGPYGLSEELGISMAEAGRYIDDYLSHYPWVGRFIDACVEDAGKTGLVKTMLGRIRFMPELKSPVDAVKRLGQRLAVNTTIQGSAADIIKLAMIKVYANIKSGGKSAQMLLQIHDELLFEVPADYAEEFTGIIKREMEGVLSLKVPLKVNIKQGNNWRLVE